VAVRLRAEDGLPPVFEREYADHDWISSKGASSSAQKFFEKQGYKPHTRFNSLNGREHLLFFDESHDRQVDVFVGSFRMSHEIPFGKRLDSEPLTIPLAELLLTKLQIVELNEKDVKDALALLYDHPVEDEDGDSVNGGQIAKLCASDWGLWRTFTANLESLGDHIGRYDLPEEDQERIADRIRALQEHIEGEPKTFGWKVRSKKGDRKRCTICPKKSKEDRRRWRGSPRSFRAARRRGCTSPPTSTGPRPAGARSSTAASTTRPT
jgi:hypothetical protein